MTDKLDREKRLIEWWKEQWNGTESYEQILTYLTFVAIGFGMGSMFTIRKLILENPQHLTDALASDTQAVTKLSLSIAIVSILLLQLCITVINFRRSRN